MSLTPAVGQTLRHALATVVVVPVTPLCRADVRPPSRLLPADVKDEIRAILTGWGLA
jgi:hypothetical protein